MRKVRGQRTRKIAKRNPVARALRDTAFRARAWQRPQNTRKRKHRARSEE